MTANGARIPVLLMVDAEPNGFFIRRDRADPWRGFERGVEIMAELRRSIVERTGRAAHFTWLVRADPQIEGTYGSTAWGLDRYRAQLQSLQAEGDEIGLHVHAYRWEPTAGNWIEDYGDQDWVAHCVRDGFSAFESAMQRRPAAFSMGMDWTNQATMQMVRDLGVRWELSLIPGTEPRPLRFLTGSYTGTAPDGTRIPRLPYPPARDDFRQPCDASASDLWIFPLSSYVAPLELSWKRRLYNRLRFKPVERRVRKFFLTDAHRALRPAIDDALRDTPPYITLSVRTDKFLHRSSIGAIRANLRHLLQRAGRDLVFATPGESLRVLEATDAGSRGSVPG